MTNTPDLNSVVVEIQGARLSLEKVCDAYGSVMALCELVQPGLKDAFTQYPESDASPAELRVMLNKRSDVIYNVSEVLRMVLSSMETIDESTAGIGGCMDSITEYLTGQPDQEVNHE